MDGVFMKKLIRFAVCLLVAVSAIYIADVWQDKNALQESLIRLHVVANSDSSEDQAVKLQVRDAIVSYLQPIAAKCSNKEQAMAYIRENLDSLQNVANNALQILGQQTQAVVSLDKEIFDTREYDTFSLPAGVYESLRITIGEGQGKNWWCVVFPSLCLPATGSDFQATAVSAGFSENLSDTLRGGCNFRFFLLDCWGKLEKLFN